VIHGIEGILQSGAFAFCLLILATLTDHLIDGWHLFPPKFLRQLRLYFSLNEAICFIDGLAAFPTHWDKNPITETTEADYNTSKNARQENL
jgi:hypothetical protein